MTNRLLQQALSWYPEGLFRDKVSGQIVRGMEGAITTVQSKKWALLRQLSRLFDPAETPVQFLEAISSAAGMGSTMATTAHMTEDDFRRFLDRAMGQWIKKGTSERELVEAFTGVNCVLLDWWSEAIDLGLLPFPWTVLYPPGYAVGDEYFADIYVEDNPVGYVNRLALLRLLQETRQLGESRIVVFDLFLDDFISGHDVNGDHTPPWLWRWHLPGTNDAVGGVNLVTIGSGAAWCHLYPETNVFGITRHSYNVTFNVKAISGVGIPTATWFIHDLQPGVLANNCYGLDVQWNGVGSVLNLVRYTGGVPVILAAVAYTLDPDVEYRVDIRARTNAGSVDLRVSIDGNLIIAVNDAAVTRKQAGTFGYFSNAGTVQTLTMVSVSSLIENDLYRVDKDGIYQFDGSIPAWVKIG